MKRYFFNHKHKNNLLGRNRVKENEEKENLIKILDFSKIQFCLFYN